MVKQCAASPYESVVFIHARQSSRSSRTNYGIDRQLHYRCRDDGNPGDYLINPYHVLTANGRYYLPAGVDKDTSLAHFRIERIMDIQRSDHPTKPFNQVEGCKEGIDIRHYATGHPAWAMANPGNSDFGLLWMASRHT